MRELIQQLVKALEQHDAFAGAVKCRVGFAKVLPDITGYRPGLGAQACDEIILNYPPDPYDVLEKARKALRDADSI